VMVSAISNGGKIVVPQIPRTKFEQANFNLTTRGTIALPTTNLRGVVPGMIGAGTYGTARRGVDSALGIAGKTGSCIGQGSWLGLFASVAPVANPKLAVVVITRGELERGKYAAAIAGRIYQSLSYRLREKGAKPLIAQTPAAIKPQPKIDAKTAALLDKDAEGIEDAEDNDALSKGKKGGADNGIKTELIEKAAKKTESPSPIFAPVVITVRKENPEIMVKPEITVKKENLEPTRLRIVSNK
ncbi:MAG: penicillin-binding transpeptidase domain-containing protein, partial [Acidobacteriota bacterium]|nr:penicillin-binding transpeptidase domain-containing protein [Acidobacteriota bacterium]